MSYLGGGGSTFSAVWFCLCMGSGSSCWFCWSWFNLDCLNLMRIWFTNWLKYLRNSYLYTALGVGTKDGPFDRRDFCGDVKSSDVKFMAFIQFCLVYSFSVIIFVSCSFQCTFIYELLFRKIPIFPLFVVYAVMISNFVPW